MAILDNGHYQMGCHGISHMPEGYFLEPATADSPHVLCGPQHIKGAISPNTGRPLLLLVSLDPADPRLGISHLKLNTLHLLYSWTCGISDGVFSYRESSGEVEIIAYTKGPLHTDFPYENYPLFFPRVPVELKALTSEEQIVIERFNRPERGRLPLANQFPQLWAPRSQVGGVPRLMQWPLRPCYCRVCRGTMPLLASVGNQTGSALGFTTNDFVQTLFFLCTACRVVTAHNMCD